MPRDGKLNRRSLLKGTAAATGGFVAGVGSAAAASGTDVRHPIERRYLEPRALESAVREHAGDLLEELDDRGLLSSSVEDLPLDNLEEDEHIVEETDAERKVGVISTGKDGFRTAHIMISENTPTHRIAIYVQPEAGESYAHVQPKDDELSKFSINPGRANTKATTSSDCGGVFYICDEDRTPCNASCSTSTCTDLIYYCNAKYEEYECGSTFDDCCAEFKGCECGVLDDCYCQGCCENCP